MRLIWKVVLLFWKRKSPRIFHSAGYSEKGRFFRDARLTFGREKRLLFLSS